MATDTSARGSLGRISVPTTQADYAHSEIRKGIITGTFKSGDRLVQSELAAELAVSVTPVREALQRLKEEGLVASLPHRGTTVAMLDLAAAEEIYAMRKLVEPLLIRKTFSSITASDITKARELVARMRETDDLLAFADLNEQFHETTMKYDDSWTSRIVHTLAGASSPYVSFSLRLRPEQIGDSHVAHDDIINAIEANDVERVVALELAHLDSTISILRELGDRV